MDSFRELRKAAGLTAAAAAKAAGVSAAALGRIERGQTDEGFRGPANPSMKVVVALLRLYGKDKLADFLEAAPKGLQTMRKAVKMSRQQLADQAEAVGITTARAVQSIELGTRTPTLDQMADLLGAFSDTNKLAGQLSGILRDLVAYEGSGHGNTKPVEQTAKYRRQQEVQARRAANEKMRIKAQLERYGYTGPADQDDGRTPTADEDDAADSRAA